LKFGGGLKNTEIGELIGLRAVTVAVKLYRILKKLKKTLSEPEQYYEKNI
jgi:DNA-directed RNA polymerase specialized sigma24 family protein